MNISDLLITPMSLFNGTFAVSYIEARTEVQRLSVVTALARPLPDQRRSLVCLATQGVCWSCDATPLCLPGYHTVMSHTLVYIVPVRQLKVSSLLLDIQLFSGTQGWTLVLYTLQL